MNGIPYEWLSLTWVAAYYRRQPSYMRAIQREKRKPSSRRNYKKVPQATLDRYPDMERRGRGYEIHGSRLAAWEAARERRTPYVTPQRRTL
jgi:hypothetical protein